MTTDHLLLSIIPLYIFIAIGALLGRKLKMETTPIALLMFYVLFPATVFEGIRKTEFSLVTAMLPVMTFAIACFCCFLFYAMSRVLWGTHDTRPSIIGLVAGTKNCGYFGLPVAAALFDATTTSLYITIFTGLTIFESSVGYYVAARGQYSKRDSLIKVAKLPALYAFVVALAVSAFHVPMLPFHETMMGYVRGAYIFCGMLMVGLGLAQVKSYKIDVPFLMLTLFATFIIWPLVVQIVIFADRYGLMLLTEAHYKGLTLLSIVPLAANSVAIATIFRSHPEKVATAVLISTLIALVYVPWMANHLLR